MAKFVVFNCSEHSIEIVIPAPQASGRSGACMVVESSMSLDILPWAGSLEACHRIAFLKNLRHRGLIRIIEEK